MHSLPGFDDECLRDAIVPASRSSSKERKRLERNKPANSSACDLPNGGSSAICTHDLGSGNELPQCSRRRRFKNEIVGKKNRQANHKARSFIKESSPSFSANDHNCDAKNETNDKLSQIVDDKVCESCPLPGRFDRRLNRKSSDGRAHSAAIKQLSSSPWQCASRRRLVSCTAVTICRRQPQVEGRRRTRKKG